MKNTIKIKMKTVAILLSVAAALTSCKYMNKETHKGVKVLDKERIVDGEDSYYLVYTDQGEFTVKDELFRGNFNSSSWYGMLKIDSCYNLTTGGYRSGVLSMYKNIHEKPEECPCKQETNTTSFNSETKEEWEWESKK